MKMNFDFSNHNRKIWCTVIGVTLYSILFHGIFLNDFNIGKIIGTIVGLILFPYILSTVINFIYTKLTGNGSSVFFKLFFFLVVLFVVSNLVSTLNENEGEPSEKDTIYLNDNSYKYSPESSNFTIIFPEKPKYSKTFFVVDSSQIEGELVELLIEQPESLLRVEYLKNDLIRSLDEESIINLMNTVVLKDGMYNPEIKKVNDSNWKEYELRMYKNLESVETKKPTPITYRVRVLINENELILVSSGCQSSIFPTLQITNFNSSFKWKKSS